VNDLHITTKLIQEIFEGAAWNVIGKLALIWLVAVITVTVANYLLATYTEIGRDDTDPPRGRSNMKILIDHQTGCQYLMSARGGLTPRLDESGRLMYSKKSKAKGDAA
jgi:hypothetical protein